MPLDCVANTDNLHTIPKDRLRQRIVTMTREQDFAMTNALRYSLAIDW
jgi:mRNA-degrading endonuclease toxin of MazEF toxin-antitoxin module